MWNYLQVSETLYNVCHPISGQVFGNIWRDVKSGWVFVPASDVGFCLSSLANVVEFIKGLS